MSDKFISALRKIKSDKKITIGEIADELQGDALMVIGLICTLPFLQPIPFPGVSSIFAFVIALQGFSLIVSGKPFLTKRLKNIEISAERFELFYKAAEKFSSYANKISVAPSRLYVPSRLNKIFTGILIVIISFFLSLPLPIPLSNFIPALAIFFLCLSILEEDLILALIGQVFSFAIMVGVYFSGDIVIEQIKKLLDYII